MAIVRFAWGAGIGPVIVALHLLAITSFDPSLATILPAALMILGCAGLANLWGAKFADAFIRALDSIAL